MQITIIGGGSYQWTPELLADLLSTESLHGAHYVLEDIDPVPLEKMEALGPKVSEALGAGATFDATTDQRRALEGADFVIVTISTGGFDSMAVDLDVPAPLRHPPVGRRHRRARRGQPVPPEHSGAGGGGGGHGQDLPGRLVAQHHQPDDLPDPGGLPADRGQDGRASATRWATGPWTWPSPWASRHEAVNATVAGVNHFPVVTALDVDGEDGFAILAEMVEEAGGLAALAPGPDRPEAEEFTRLDFCQRHALKLTMLEKWGALPAAGDRHIAEFVPWVLTEESDWGADFNIELTPIERRQEHQDGYIADVDAWLAGDQDAADLAVGELPALVIDSLVTGEAPLPPGQHPQRRPGSRRPGRLGGGVDLRGGRGRDPRP